MNFNDSRSPFRLTVGTAVPSRTIPLPWNVSLPLGVRPRSRKTVFGLGAALCFGLLACPSSAQTAEPPRDPAPMETVATVGTSAANVDASFQREDLPDPGRPGIPERKDAPSASPSEPRQGDAALRLGAKAGVALPFGSIGGTPSQDLRELFASQFPIGIDLGFAITPAFHLALGGSLGGMVLGSSFDHRCGSGAASCSAYGARLGVQAEYHFRPMASSDPWIGYGVGYEWASVKVSTRGGSASATLGGPEVGRIAAGVDFGMGKGWRIGPYAEGAHGWYSRVSQTRDGGATRSDTIESTSPHTWLGLGARIVGLP